ncbi:MAG: class II fructose-bisphosphate aldolase [Erysipelotrichaceae bacterium]|jgi:fructose-bisphosphate aldolase class II|nr:class II fructose-bisphosphate aldolase [Erysipelotrichaceae bacterium]
MLVSFKEMLQRASAENYAVAAPNINSELDARAFVEAAVELNAPLILDLGWGVHPDPKYFIRILEDMVNKVPIPVTINLDHGNKKEDILKAIACGFPAVMVDRSSLPFDQNVKEVKEIVEIAHSCGVSVEAELGHVGQADNYENDRDAALTSAKEAVDYIAMTGVDALAVAIGTAHGAYPKGFVPYLDFERLQEIKKATGNFPLVLHGSSGTDPESLRKACSLGINKVNIANDLCKAAVAAILNSDMEGNKAYDVWVVIQKAIKERLKQAIELYGSANKAWSPDFSWNQKAGSLRE